MNENKPTFEEAINATMVWCNAWQQGELSEEVLSDRVAELLVNKEGIRGFFAISLASDFALLDRLPDSLLMELRNAGNLVVDITTRNLAMSSAMIITHKRNKDIEKQSGSERVKSRCIEILRLLDPLSVKERLEKMLIGISGLGEDADFLKRWNYDMEQKNAIKNSINEVA